MASNTLLAQSARRMQASKGKSKTMVLPNHPRSAPGVNRLQNSQWRLHGLPTVSSVCRAHSAPSNRKRTSLDVRHGLCPDGTWWCYDSNMFNGRCRCCPTLCLKCTDCRIRTSCTAQPPPADSLRMPAHSAVQDEHENVQVDVPEEEEFERPHWKKSEALWKVVCQWHIGVVLEAHGQQAMCETVRKEAARYHGGCERTVEPCGHESDMGNTADWNELVFAGEGENEDYGDLASPSASFQDESGVLNPEEDAVTDNERSESESEDTQYSEHSRSRSPTPDSDHDSDPDSLPYLGLIRLSRFPVEPLEEPFPELNGSGHLGGCRTTATGTGHHGSRSEQDVASCTCI
ncbi:hypothetical protein B0H21DRAFT_73423 [Amylocystis lapponica]|nr:hypothetical protein B0H21DRAFT_73423 [Amylocystis lapponica]